MALTKRSSLYGKHSLESVTNDIYIFRIILCAKTTMFVAEDPFENKIFKTKIFSWYSESENLCNLIGYFEKYHLVSKMFWKAFIE